MYLTIIKSYLQRSGEHQVSFQFRKKKKHGATAVGAAHLPLTD